jgi:hypothetical protein
MARRAGAFAAFHLLARLVFEPLAYDRGGPEKCAADRAEQQTQLLLGQDVTRLQLLSWASSLP